MAVATGVGSWPGPSMARALREIEAVLGGVPFLPELPQRPGGDMVARAVGLLDGTAAGELVREDVAAWLPFAGGGPLTVSCAGPVTLAAASGAQDVAGLARRLGIVLSSLAAGVADRLGSAVGVQLDEPLLCRPGPAAVAALADLVEVLTARNDGPVLVHSCAQPVACEVLAALGVPASVDATGLAALPAGWRAGVVPTTGPVDVDAIVARLGELVPRAAREGLVVTPTCGLGLSPDAPARLRAVVEVASRIVGA